MAKFKLGAHVTVSAYTEIEADTLEEAKALASAREVVIGGLHSGTDSEEQWIIDDADGAPENIHRLEGETL